jgi:hypothetical protein
MPFAEMGIFRNGSHVQPSGKAMSQCPQQHIQLSARGVGILHL